MTAPPASRRGFLRDSTALATAAVLFPTVIPASALGRGPRLAPSERVRLGHIGVGNQGGFLFDQFQKVAAAQSVAVADTYTDRRERRSSACGGKAHADFRELLARDDVDAVVVATPDHWHIPIALMAARAGKDCYVEKPLGLSVEQDLACRDLFKEKGRVFQYGTQQRSQDHCRRACELVRLGHIGEIKSVEVLAPNGGTGGSTAEAPVPPGFDYEMWLGPAPAKPYTVDRCHPQGTYWIYDQSIGYLGGWGAHPLDLLVWACDVDLAGPWTVEGSGRVPETGLYDVVYDWDMTFHMANNVTMTFRPGTDSTKFIGSEGWIQVSRGGWDAEPKSLLDLVVPVDQGRLIRSPNHYANFVDAVRSRSGTVTTLADAVRSDVISHMCDIAVRIDRPVTWDPAKESIVVDAEAAAMLRRDLRSPWTL